MTGNPDPIHALVFVRLDDPSPARFERFLGGVDGVVAAWHVIGDIDLAVHVHCADLSAVDRLLTAMRFDGGGVSLTGLAAEHGTPTYVLDEADVRLRCRQYLTAFGAGRVAYTAKALLSVGIARWIEQEGLHLYVGSAGELRVAQAAGFPSDRTVLYGSAKTPQDLDAAYAAGVGTIVVESLSEITRLAATAPHGQRVLLRVFAGPEPADGADNRFGPRIGTGEANTAVTRIVGQPGLRLAGFDCSVGHQVSRFSVYERELHRIVAFCAAVKARHGAVAGTGAYHHSRASNYHLVPRPALIGVAGGQARTLVRRETLTDLLSRDSDHQAD
ncbi:Lrp/AsnC ligand binding domain-containing protein [Dactylosporangium sp. NPDC050588]|uniref:Lrp/AsnC ligand binding domain-containing protein n=1 Tax=Dactylosporangium sp. NPDC050588 TaxID=3157211 RepID=UPI0033DAF761